ncbi:MAG: hypothetical protein L3J43_03585 [Sulfurovum sp.]|nr:hypothetical protein [Sulfurovum sp.]
MQHHDFLKSLKALKNHFNKKNISSTYIHHSSKQKSICICQDSNGEFKYLYKTKDELAYMLASKSINLKSYPCPYEKGWHITKV